MEEEIEVIVENNIRKFAQVLNEKKVRRDNIITCFYKETNNEYIALICK